MARTGESGSRCADRKRDTTASSEGLVATASSCVNSGNPSERFMGFSPLLCYGTTKTRAVLEMDLVFADELVAFQSGGDLERRDLLKAVVRGLCPQHLADA